MSRGDDLRLADIVDAAAEMRSVVEPGRDAFLADPIRIRAAERLLELVGEAATALSSEFVAQHPDVDWRSITRLRVLLAHHYQRVDPEQVWTMATIDLPDLARHLTGDQ